MKAFQVNAPHDDQVGDVDVPSAAVVEASIRAA